MISSELYYRRLKDLEKEVRDLKTSHFKTATTINTMTRNRSLSFSLTWDSLSGQIYSTKRAIITATTSDGTDMISSCYLSGITPSNINDRFIFIKRLNSNSGEVRYAVNVFSQNYDDYQTLSGGGTVNLNYTIQIVGSSEFTITDVTYRNYDGGTQ